LRQPVEDGQVTLARARFSVTYPSRCQMVLATNPCPCGHLDDLAHPCMCAPGRLTAYKERLSGPLMDRVDLGLQVPRLSKIDIFSSDDAEPSEVIRRRVMKARERQVRALTPFGITANADIPARGLEAACRLTKGARTLIENARTAHGLSMRGTHRLMRVARTIADLDGASEVMGDHVTDATRLRLMR
jgi:magnesium chelatase family protein